MKLYYFAEGGQEKGPFTIEELKGHKIKSSTLVWTEGMDEWEKGGSIPELSKIIVPSPPPLPSGNLHISDVRNSLDGYDITSKRYSVLTYIGIFLIVLYATVLYLLKFEINDETRVYFAIGSFVLRVIVVVWCVKAARILNRNSFGWGVFAFFLPALALIIQGLLRRKLYPKGYLALSDSEKAVINHDHAINYFSNGHNQAALGFVEKAIDLDNSSADFFDTKGLILTDLKQHVEALECFNKAIEMNPDLGEYYWNRGNLFFTLNDEIKSCADWTKALEVGNLEPNDAAEIKKLLEKHNR